MNEIEQFNDKARTLFAPYVGQEIVVHSIVPFRSDKTGQLLRLTSDGMILAGYGYIPFDQISLTPTTFGWPT